MKCPLRIILVGPPGSGKGTQGIRLAEKLGIPYIATGQIVREEIGRQTEFGQLIERRMAEGYFLTDLQALELIKCSVPGHHEPFILDGYPRTLVQAQQFIAWCETFGAVRTLWLDLPIEESRERIAGRLVCRSCGRSYHERWIPSTNSGICDVDGSELYRRPEDSPDVIDRRMEIYRNLTVGVIEYYQERGYVSRVDASGTYDQVFNRIWELIYD